MNTSNLKHRAIYVTRHGSHAYGLNTASSDLDIKGVLVAEKAHYMGFLNKVEQIEERQPNDLVIYELSKFFKLASDCNPNIVEVLFSAPEDVLFCHPTGARLRSMRDSFLSQKAKHTFSGYAMSQLKRMKNHHSWMKNAPKPPPSRVEFGLPQSKQWCSGMEADIAAGITTVKSYSEEQQVLLDRENQWRGQARAWNDYQKWLEGRNEKRHELEMKFGYDTKHGMHLVRLLRMGYEILTEGEVRVKRHDREELLAIRNEGIWSYDEMVAYAEKMDRMLDEIYKANTSPLPREPDRKLLDQLCVAMIYELLDTWSGPNWHGLA